MRGNIKPDLRILLIEITAKCNALCDHCGSRCDAYGEELLKKEDILRLFDDVRDHFGTGTMINITGGEPLLRKDLFEIMSYAHELGFDWGMVTNGTLITDEVIEKMKASGMRTITVSIDGLKETHESVRHLPGSFDRIIANLKKLAAADFLDCVQVTFTSNKKNYREFPELYEILKTTGIASVRTSFIDPIGRALEHDELMMGREEMRFMIDFANRVNREDKLPVVWGCPHYLGGRLGKRRFVCFAGIYAASVLYNGDFFVCPNVPRRPELIQGNIRTDRFSEVWVNGYEYFRNRPLPDRCKSCRYREDCDGDSLHTFDFERQEPLFCYREIFDVNTGRYEEWLHKHFGRIKIETVMDEGSAPAVYIEPEAYEDIRHFFHVGRRHPLSLFEQQMGLVGFKVDGDYVVRYVFPATINSIASDLATFNKNTMKHAMEQTKIIKRNIGPSDDAHLPGADRLKFLGFIHSHPVQEELTYSIGDELMHNRLCDKLGDYIGILINPEHDLLGAYCGRKDIIQARLKLVSIVKGEGR